MLQDITVIALKSLQVFYFQIQASNNIYHTYTHAHTSPITPTHTPFTPPLPHLHTGACTHPHFLCYLCMCTCMYMQEEDRVPLGMESNTAEIATLTCVYTLIISCRIIKLIILYEAVKVYPLIRSSLFISHAVRTCTCIPTTCSMHIQQCQTHVAPLTDITLSKREKLIP